ncbi:MAG: hypothetical protein OEQ53_20450 [Saprospiraceae bacterium]|nr:hypothetical protein [Saprospiraceae bacterium]
MKANPFREQKIPRFTSIQILQGIEGIAVITACYITFFLKPLRDRWGLSKKETERTFPGDELVAEPKSQFTHAVDIDAPTEYVWPWISQIGQGRGGFYSYEALENIVGSNISNSDKVLPAFQNPQIGDLISFGPHDAYPLVICKPGEAMAIENWYDLDTKQVYDPKLSSPENYLHLTWLWYVESVDTNRTRFISRNRLTYNSSVKARLMFGPITEPIVFAMDRKMCLGIKRRAEALFRKTVP